MNKLDAKSSIRKALTELNSKTDTKKENNQRNEIKVTSTKDNSISAKFKKLYKTPEKPLMSPYPDIKKPTPIMTPMVKTGKFGDFMKNQPKISDKSLLGHDLKSKHSTQNLVTKSPVGQIRKLNILINIKFDDFEESKFYFGNLSHP